jgi:hypothetical protein
MPEGVKMGIFSILTSIIALRLAILYILLCTNVSAPIWPILGKMHIFCLH